MQQQAHGSADGRRIPPLPAMEVALSPVEIDPRVNRVNVPEKVDFPNRPHLERYFDLTTLLYDVFRDIDGATVHAVGPQLPPSLRMRRDIAFTALPSGRPCNVAYSPGAESSASRYRFEPPVGTDAIQVRFGRQEAIVPIQPNLAHLFAGRRALLTMQRNNPLAWIVDWVTFHVRHQGVDAVLLYDNNSTAYDWRDVRRAIAAIPGITQVVVVSWDYPYGINPPNVGLWSQPGAIVHAQRRMLGRAAWVISCDIDELMVSFGDQRIDNVVATSPAPWFTARAEVAASIRSRGEGPLRHRDFLHIHPGFHQSGPKIVIVPDRLSSAAEWSIHEVGGVPGEVVDTDVLRMYHIVPLTTGALGRETRLPREDGFTPVGVVDEPRYERILDEIFPEDEPAPTAAPWTELEGRSSLLASRRAKQLLAAGDADAALPYIEHAIRLNHKDAHLQEVRLAILDRIATNPS